MAGKKSAPFGGKKAPPFGKGGMPMKGPMMMSGMPPRRMPMKAQMKKRGK